MDRGSAHGDHGNNQQHPLPAKPRLPPRLQHEAVRSHAGVGDGYTCCLTCLQPADAEHRKNWLNCTQCHVHGAQHVGNLCPLFKAMSLAFVKAHTGETKKMIVARSKSGRIKVRHKREAKRRNNARQGGGEGRHGGLPGFQVLPENHRAEELQRPDPAPQAQLRNFQPDQLPLIDQGNETQRHRPRSPTRGDLTRDGYRLKSPPRNFLNYGRHNSPLRFTFVGYEGDERHPSPQPEAKPSYMYTFNSDRRKDAAAPQILHPVQTQVHKAPGSRLLEVIRDSTRMAVLQSRLNRLVCDFGQSRSQELGRQIMELSRELQSFAMPDHRMDDVGGVLTERRGTDLQINRQGEEILVAKDEEGREYFLVKAEEGVRSAFRPDLIQ